MDNLSPWLYPMLILFLGLLIIASSFFGYRQYRKLEDTIYFLTKQIYRSSDQLAKMEYIVDNRIVNIQDTKSFKDAIGDKYEELSNTQIINNKPVLDLIYSKSVDNKPDITRSAIINLIRSINAEDKPKTINSAEELETKLKTISNVSSDIAHSLKTPLSGIKAALSLLETEKNNDLKLQSVLLQENVEILEELISGYAQLGNDKADNNKTVNLKKEIEKSFKTLSLSERKKINLQFSIPEHLEMENEKYNSLLIALVSVLQNAFDASPDNGIVKTTIHVDKDSLKFEIFNTGENIDKNLGNIFERNFSTKNSSGLGLSTANDVITEHFNGSIFYQNESNGVTFFITIPMKPTGG